MKRIFGFSALLVDCDSPFGILTNAVITITVARIDCFTTLFLLVATAFSLVTSGASPVQRLRLEVIRAADFA
jgi:hypothetical protein